MSKDLYKIEFLEGEDWCRVQGILLDEQEWLERTGIPREFEVYTDDGKKIVFDGKIYTDSFCIGDIIPLICSFEEGTGEEYDIISNAGRGETSHYLQEKYAGRNGAFILKSENFNSIKDMVIVPLSEFKKDFPLFNKEEYFKIVNSLDEYYNNFKNLDEYYNNFNDKI